MDRLVSVVITTYNSSKYILETLDSVAAQTWDAIELVITDDGSRDDTMDRCHDWLANHGKRFRHTDLLISESNTGVAANVNRGLFAAKGEWIKLLAGDDVLLPDCLKDNMDFVSNDPSVRILLSRVQVYQNNFEQKDYIATTPPTTLKKSSIVWPGRTAESQYRMLLLGDKIHFTPSFFSHRETLISVGAFDERFRFFEDYPMWLRLTSQGNKLHYMNKVTVKYRQHPGALNNSGIPYLINPNYFKAEKARREYTYPNLPFDIMLGKRFEWICAQLFRSRRMNRDSKMNRFLHTVVSKFLNPFEYLIWVRKQMMPKLKNNEFYQ